MNIDIRKNFAMNVHGLSAMATTNNYVDAAFSSSDKMWKVVNAKQLKNKGKNIWIYGPGKSVFTGVELNDPSYPDTVLEQRKVVLDKYAYYKHIGPYNLIALTGKAIRKELEQQGFEVIDPYIEIYGHWTNDQTKLETELLMCLK